MRPHTTEAPVSEFGQFVIEIASNNKTNVRTVELRYLIVVPTGVSTVAAFISCLCVSFYTNDIMEFIGGMQNKGRNAVGVDSIRKRDKNESPFLLCTVDIGYEHAYKSISYRHV
jgi:hypothetical protein